MLIGILETGDVAPEMRARHGSFADMFRRLLAGQGFAFRVWRVVDGQLPADPAEADGWLITGSKHAVYDDLPWIEPLKDFIRRAAAARAPMAGICFGHQIMAEALGGRVEKSERGWGIGPQTYDSVEAGRPITILASHQDQVTRKPPSAEVVASSEFCPYAGLVYRDAPAISYQPHPEFRREFSRELIETRRGTVYDPALADAALARMDAPLDSDWMARRIADFFRAHARPARNGAGDEAGAKQGAAGGRAEG
ncbi:glutamine amidotransferase-related protein [Oceanicella actignis]|uniref:GMP synthase-Glutamine amidotransferase n=1 Tax=Oceanicella actignis TaxID=1189325 RepID=A0A1M7RZK6_9RHOB|nr:hypothetical protein [Oceanicella actignis]SES95219.1 GMP synthase-Glutamine amidotransferase [Oceanicella actignis]SHN51554.1 GMP synthase-Glutamine amidotransferase [Oceanicella actignis]